MAYVRQIHQLFSETTLRKAEAGSRLASMEIATREISRDRQQTFSADSTLTAICSLCGSTAHDFSWRDGKFLCEWCEFPDRRPPGALEEQPVRAFQLAGE